LAGERADPDTVHWASSILNRPVIDNYWQTETGFNFISLLHFLIHYLDEKIDIIIIIGYEIIGWPIVSNFMNLQYFPIKEGSATKSVPGFNLHVLGMSQKLKKSSMHKMI
jgi:acyl-coenzyme A synthetase/AMP-(fatty) acid ligase